MSFDEIAIRVCDVSKHYLLFNQPQDRLKQSIIPRLQRLTGREPKRYYRDFAALSHVSFEVRRGETVGVIGRNGSGKSTLLQVVCGTLRPNSGTVEVNGRIAALLELGAGFNPEFTGRENVYLNAAILGLPRSEIDARFEDIARFADIGDFIDQPVKTYSSGMYVRLAFATAINVDPDILVVDEALAVGDEAFQRKCYARIEQIQERGGTILFVTHGVQTVVQLCTRALLFDGGELILDGPPKLVTSQYQRLVNTNGELAAAVRRDIVAMRESAERPLLPRGTDDRRPEAPLHRGDLTIAYMEDERFDANLVPLSTVPYEHAGATITDVRFENTAGVKVNVLRIGAVYYARYDVLFDRPASSVRFGFQVKTVNGLVLAGSNTVNVKHAQLAHVFPGQKYRVSFTFVCRFLPGTYVIDTGLVGIVDGTDRFLHRIVDSLMFRVGPVRDSYDCGHFSLDTRLDLTRSEIEQATA